MTYVPTVHAISAGLPVDPGSLVDLNTPFEVEQVPGLQMGPGQSFWFLGILPDGKVAIPSQPLTTNGFFPTGTDLEMLIYDPDAKSAQKLVIPTSTGSLHPIANLAGGLVGGSDFEDCAVMTRDDGERVLVASLGRAFNFWDPAVDGVYPTIAVFRAQPDGTWAYDAGYSKTAAQLATSGTATAHGLFPVITWLGTNVTTARSPGEQEVFPQSGHLLQVHYDDDRANGHHSGGLSVYDRDLTRLLEYQVPEVTHPDGGLLSIRPRDLIVDPTGVPGNETFCVIYDTFNAVGQQNAPALGNERLSANTTGGNILGWTPVSASVAQDATNGSGAGPSVKVTAAFTATPEIDLLPGLGRDIDSGNLIVPASWGRIDSAADITHWSTTSSNLAYVGGKGLRVQMAGAAIGGATLDHVPLTDTVPCTPGHVGELIVTVEAVATARDAQCGLRFYNSAGTRIASAFQTPGKDTVGSGTTYTVAALIPAGAVTMAGAVTFGTNVTDVPVLNEQHYIRGMEVHEVPSGFRVEPGVPYQISVSAKAAVTARFIRPQINFYDKAGTFISQSRMSATTKDTTGSQTVVTFTSTNAPNGAWWGSPGVFIGGTTDIPAAGEIHYVSAPSFKVAPGSGNRLFCAQVWAYDSTGPTLTPLSAPFFSDDRYRMQVAGFAPNGDLWVSTTLPGGTQQGPLCIWQKTGGQVSVIAQVPADANWQANTATSQWGLELAPDVKLSGLTGGYLMNIPFDTFTDTAWLPDSGHSPGNGAQAVLRTVNPDGSISYQPDTKIDLHSYDLFPAAQPWLFAKAVIDSTRRRLFYPARGATFNNGPVAPYDVPNWLYQIDLEPAPSLHRRTDTTTEALLGLIDVSMRYETIRFDLLDQQLNYVRTVYPARGGASVDWNSTSTTKRRLDGFQLTPIDADAVDVFTQRVQPVWILENGAEFPCGVFMFSDSNRHRKTYGQDLQGTLYDQTPMVDQARPYSFNLNPGASVRDAILQLVAETGVPRFLVDPSQATVITPYTVPGGTSRMQILTDLAGLGGYYAPYFTNDGALRLKAVPVVLSEQDPDFLFNDDNSTMFRDTIIESEDLVSAPNRYVVISSGATASEIVGVYDLPDQAPLSAYNRAGLVIAKVINVQGITDTNTATVRARNEAAQDYSAGEWVDFDTTADPRHDGFNLSQYRYLPYRETAWNLKLTPGGPLHLSMRQVYG